MIRYLRKIKSLFKSNNENVLDLKIKKYCAVGLNTNFYPSNLNIGFPKNEKYFFIGQNSQISGNFYIENNSGRINIGNRTFIGDSKFVCINQIIVGDDVMISWGCTIIDNDSHSIEWENRKDDVLDWKKGIDEDTVGKYKNWENVDSKKVVIKDKAWISFNCTILKGVTIGEGSIVGAGSIVTKDVPDWSVVAGNPARIIKTLKDI